MVIIPIRASGNSFRLPLILPFTTESYRNVILSIILSGKIYFSRIPDKSSQTPKLYLPCFRSGSVIDLDKP